MKNDSHIVINGLSIKFGNNLIIDSIGLTIHKGEFVVVLGKSGVGKSSILNAIAGFVNHSGTIHKPQKVRFVFQEPNLLPWFKVRRNIAIGIGDQHKASNNKSSIKLKQKEIESAVDLLINELEISELADRYPFNLSGGEKQRVALARAFVSNPDLILMDEPFSSLDIDSKEYLQGWLLNYWQKTQTTILYVTHDIEEAILLGDRILVLKDKKIAHDFKIGFERPRDINLKYTESFFELRKNIARMYK